jgi:uncharacterized SAM-binding protein YcdF (DUF218 family)
MTIPYKQKIKFIVTPLLLCTGLLLLALHYASLFLAYADKPSKSDAIVVFMSINYNDRLREAYRLVADGYADYLIIPIYRKIVKVDVINPRMPTFSAEETMKARAIEKMYPGYYENTHIEILEAKKVMDEFRWKSMILVSSPDHMRRIRLMAMQEFGENGKYKFFMVPACEEQSSSKRWYPKTWQLRIAAMEYIKMAWFMIYVKF